MVGIVDLKLDSEGASRRSARDFEALMIGNMLKTVRESSLGSGWGTEDQAGSVALEMAEQQISQMMASQGGLGLARLISKGLEQKPSASQTLGPPVSKS